MFRSTPNSVVGSLNSSSSIETSYSLGSASTNSLQNSCFLSLDIEDFCESYSRLKLAERDPAQDVNSPTTSSISNTMMRNTTIISSSLNNNNTTITQPTIIQELNLFETRHHQQEDLNNNNQQNIDNDDEEYIQSSSSLSNQQVSSNYESFSKFLAFLTKQEKEQNSVFVSPRSGGESSTMAMNRIISPRNIQSSNSSCINQFSYVSNNVADSLSIENIGMNIGESAASSSSPSTPTSSTTSNSILSNSNNTNPKDSKNKLASSPKRKTSTVSNISNTSSTTTTSSSGIPSLINTKLTKQNKTTRKRKNSSTSPSQLSMQFNFPMWTFHFSKGRSNK